MEVTHATGPDARDPGTVPVPREDPQRGSIPEWVMLLVMGIGIVMALWAIVQPDLADIVSNALNRLR